MPDRELDENGIPKPFNHAELHAARSAYNAASGEQAKLAVLTEYPFLAGRYWKRYQPEEGPKSKVQSPKLPEVSASPAAIEASPVPNDKPAQT